MILWNSYRMTLICLLAGTTAIAQDSQQPVCFSDAPAAVIIHLPPVVDESHFVSKMTELLTTKYVGWISRLRTLNAISTGIFQRLSVIHLKVLPERNTIGSCTGNEIDIDEGNLLIAYNMCYADACLQLHHEQLKQFNKWHDYLFDAIIQSDPITYLNGSEDFNDFIFSSGGTDSALHDQFVSELYSWMGLLVFHEVGHIILDHAARWQRKYPQASMANIAAWTSAQYAESRVMELEADNKSLELYMKLMRYDPGPILSSYVDWQMIRGITIDKSGYAVLPTHPPLKERVTNLFTTYGKIAGLHMDDILQQTMAYIDKYDSATKRGNLLDVPALRGKRPASLTINMERFMVRDAQLVIDHQQTHQTQ